MSLVKLFFKYKNSKLPSYFVNMLNSVNNDHAYHTRKQKETFVKKAKQNFPSKSCIRYFIPQELHTTPQNILDKVHSHSLKGFSCYIKHIYIKNCASTCSVVETYRFLYINQ